MPKQNGRPIPNANRSCSLRGRFAACNHVALPRAIRTTKPPVSGPLGSFQPFQCTGRVLTGKDHPPAPRCRTPSRPRIGWRQSVSNTPVCHPIDHTIASRNADAVASRAPLKRQNPHPSLSQSCQNIATITRKRIPSSGLRTTSGKHPWGKDTPLGSVIPVMGVGEAPSPRGVRKITGFHSTEPDSASNLYASSGKSCHC